MNDKVTMAHVHHFTSKILAQSKVQCLTHAIFIEKELDIDNKLHNYLKITGIINNVFKPQKNLKENKTKTVQYTSPSSLVIWQWNLGLLKHETPDV